MSTYLFNQVQENHRNYVTKVLISAVIFRRRLKTQRTSVSSKKFVWIQHFENGSYNGRAQQTLEVSSPQTIFKPNSECIITKNEFSTRVFYMKKSLSKLSSCDFFPNMSPAQSCPITKKLINLVTLVKLFCTVILFTLVKWLFWITPSERNKGGKFKRTIFMFINKMTGFAQKSGGVSITKAHQAVPDLKNIVPKVPEWT